MSEGEGACVRVLMRTSARLEEGSRVIGVGDQEGGGDGGTCSGWVSDIDVANNQRTMTLYPHSCSNRRMPPSYP